MRLAGRILGVLLVGSLLVSPTPTFAQTCGDGVIDPGETCDPPDLTLDPVRGQYKCRVDCTSCGDGVVQTADYETCDAGEFPQCGYCRTNCSELIFGKPYCPCALEDPSFADLRAQIMEHCECTSVSARHTFLQCARAELASVPYERLLYWCRRSALKCLARSVCGKPGAVTCCQTNARGRQRCTIKTSAAKCSAPNGGSASLGVSESCCEACP
jgi:hypothetical protein